MTSTPSGTAITVVVADDDVRFRTLVCSVLRGDGYTVVAEADDARSARAAVSAQRPDVVILDLVMEGSRGLSTLRQILDDDPTQPVVVISSLFDQRIEQETVALGAWYLEKAEGLEALEHAIEAAASTTARRR